MAVTCAHCLERPANTTGGLCLPCDIEIDRMVDELEQLLGRRRALEHYEAMAAEAAAEVPARLGRSTSAGQRGHLPWTRPSITPVGNAAP